MLNLTPSERRALLIIGGVVLVSLFVQWLKPQGINTHLYDYQLQDSLFNSLSEAGPINSFYNQQEKTRELSSSRGKVNKILKQKSININTAGQKELEKLPRIGPATAKRIIEYREQNGPFKSINDLDKVKRIGPKTIDLIEPYIYIVSDSL
ncbi:MAG: ComEA family DNA-binding protein [Calditrichaceae bacterium]